jgi:hypothetical protein
MMRSGYHGNSLALNAAMVINTAPTATILEQAVLQNLQEVLDTEASIERRLRRSRKTGKWNAKLGLEVSNLQEKTTLVDQLLSMLEYQHPGY